MLRTGGAANIRAHPGRRSFSVTGLPSEIRPKREHKTPVATKKTAKKKSTKEEEASFEDQLDELETLVARLEEGELGLEDALSAFENGIALTRTLMKQLDAAEKRIEVLLEREDGTTDVREIDAEDLEDAAKRGGLFDD